MDNFMFRKLKRKIRLKLKHMQFKIIISKRILTCRDEPEYSNNYVNCCRCKYTQKCYRKHNESVKWVI